MPEPLRMNPPTPTNEDPPLLNILQHDTRHDSFQEPIQQPTHDKYANHDIDEHADDDDTSTINGNNQDRQPLNDIAVNRSHTNASTQSSHFAGSSVYSESAPSLRTANHLHQQSIPDFQENMHVHSVGTPRGKQYGDLASATRGIRQHEDPQLSPSRYGQGYQQQADLPPSPPKHQVHSAYAGAGGGAGRVISRSGADITDESLFVAEHGNGSRRRYVSGKVAEEGMAGGRW
jgi:hypothetical protein